MRVIPVPLPEGRAHEIYVGAPLAGLGRTLAKLVSGRRALVVSARPIAKRYAKALLTGLKSAGFEPRLALVADGERHKTLSAVAAVYREAVRAGIDRKSPVIALGGGVIGDMAGFTAASFMRGVPFVNCPTTLLAMVDASVGGKTGVDLPEGKNMVGAFWQPRLVWMDLTCLSSLPDRQWRTGLAEIIKYGFLGRTEILDKLRETGLKKIQKDPALQEWLVERSVTTKVDVVLRDERETKGHREILNLGHTFGHAVETVTRYRAYTHGEAIAIGMVAAARLANRLGLISADQAALAPDILAAYGLPVKARRRLPLEKLLAAMSRDKKNVQGNLRLVLPDGPAHVRVAERVEPALVKEILKGVGF